MTLQTSGPISASDFKREFFDANPVKLSNYYGRTGVGTGDNTAIWTYGVDNFVWPSPFPDLRSRRNVGMVQTGSISYSDLYGRQRYISGDISVNGFSSYNMIPSRSSSWVRWYRSIATFEMPNDLFDINFTINGHIRGDYTPPGTYQNTEISAVRNPRIEVFSETISVGSMTSTRPTSQVIMSEEETIYNNTDSYTTPFTFSPSRTDVSTTTYGNFFTLVISIEQIDENRVAPWSGGMAWDAFNVEIRS